MTFGFSYIGFIWVIMLLVPNIIWTKKIPKGYEEYVKNENKILLASIRSSALSCTRMV